MREPRIEMLVCKAAGPLPAIGLGGGKGRAIFRGIPVVELVHGELFPGPEEQAIEQERYNSWKARMAARLSPLERQVLGLYLQGLSYAAIGAQLGRTTKSVENALGRARAKLRRNLP